MVGCSGDEGYRVGGDSGRYRSEGFITDQAVSRDLDREVIAERESLCSSRNGTGYAGRGKCGE